MRPQTRSRRRVRATSRVHADPTFDQRSRDRRADAPHAARDERRAAFEITGPTQRSWSLLRVTHGHDLTPSVVAASRANPVWAHDSSTVGAFRQGRSRQRVVGATSVALCARCSPFRNRHVFLSSGSVAYRSCRCRHLQSSPFKFAPQPGHKPLHSSVHSPLSSRANKACSRTSGLKSSWSPA